MVFVVMLTVSCGFALLWQQSVYHTAGERTFRLGDYQLRFESHRMLGLLSALPFFLIYSFQFSMHSDYDNYLKMYSRIQFGDRAISDIISYYIFKLVGMLGVDFQWVLLVFYAIAFFILAKCIFDYSKCFASSYILFLSLFFTMGFLQIRQFASVVIAFYAYRFIERRQFIKFAVVILIATGFHRSAIIMLPCYFILSWNFRASYYAMLFGMLFALNLFQDKVLTLIATLFFPQYLGRHELFRNTVLNKIEMAAILVLIFVVIIYYVPTMKSSRLNQIFMNAFFIQVLLFFCCRWLPEFDRFGYYFYIPAIALIPNAIATDKRPPQRIFMQFLIPLVVLLLFLYRHQAPTSFINNYVSIFTK